MVGINLRFTLTTVKKFETTSDGVTITGGLTATASSTFTSASFSGTITGVANLSDGSTAVTQSINDNSTKIATTAYVDASIDTADTLAEILAIGNTTGGTNIAVSANDDITFTDTSKAIFGDGNDLSIYHTANSFIYNTTGDLVLEQTVDDQDIVFKSDDGSGGTTEYFKLDGSVVQTVFSKKATKHEDNIYAYFGSGNDLAILHDGTNSALSNVTGDIQIIQNVDDGKIRFYADNGSGGNIEYFRVDGSSEEELYEKDLRAIDNVKIKLGGSSDLQIYHDGSNSFIKDTGTGSLVVAGSQINITNAADTEFTAKFIENGSVELYYDSSKKVRDNFNGNFSNRIRLGDNEKNQIRDSQDLQIYHDGSNSYIKDVGTGNLIIQGTQLRIQDQNGENFLVADQNG